jgi:shikimate dehydrogenase
VRSKVGDTTLIAGVIGDPISHSLSPMIHNYAFGALGLDACYVAFYVEAMMLEQFIREFRQANGMGFNITVPHKQTIKNYLDEIDPAAAAIGAVNTVVARGGKLVGYNTDVYGVVRSLEPFKDRIRGQKTVVLGAGGAARAVIYALATEFHPSTIAIINRDNNRASTLARDMQQTTGYSALSSTGWNDNSTSSLIHECTLLINTTSVGMHPNVNDSPLPAGIPLHQNQIVFDAVYTPLKTRLLQTAEAAGATVINGLDMFVHQAAKSFELWTGKTMPAGEIKKLLTPKVPDVIPE